MFVRHAIDTMTLQRVLIVAGVIALSGVAGAANGAGTMNPLASIAFAKDTRRRILSSSVAIIPRGMIA